MARTKLKQGQYYAEPYHDEEIDLADEFPGRYKVNSHQHLVHAPDIEVDIGYDEYFNFGVQKRQFNATNIDEVQEKERFVNLDGASPNRRRYISRLIDELEL